jgi:hypothetical protein
MIRFALLGIVSTALAGCSFYGDFYIVNKSANPVTAIIKFSYPIEQLKLTRQQLILKYADTILNVHDDTKNFLRTDLPFKQLNTHTLSIIAPSHSTVLIGGSMNRAIAADSFGFIINGTLSKYSLQSISRHLKKTGGVYPPYHFTYMIEK